MDTDPPEGEEVIYRAEIASEGQFGQPDTAVVVTDRTLRARPLPDVDTDSEMSLSVPLAEIESLRCEGVLSRTLTVETATETIAIPTVGLDTSRFKAAIVEHSQLTAPSGRFGFDAYSVAPCEWATSLGAAFLVIGIGMSVTFIGIVFGAPLAGAGLLILLLVAARRRLAEVRGTNVWRRRESGTEPTR
jgi:hypothetical protein